MQQQSIVVTTPFMEKKVQLFYEAFLNRTNHIVTLKIFNHRGVLKNKRVIELGDEVDEIFCAQEYLIGLDKNHEKIVIVDVRKQKNNIARGTIGQRNGLNIQLKSRKLRFNSFLYDKTSNMIYGVYGNHYVFYFKINYFLDDSIDQQQYNQSQLAQQNKCISINKIIESQQSIDKLQIKTQKVEKKPSAIGGIKQSQQLSLLKCLQQEQQQRQNNNDNNDRSNQNQQIKILICLLIKEKNLLRMIEMDWEKDTIKSIKQHKQVHDFCFMNGWDLVIKNIHYNKKQKITMKSQQQKYTIKTQHHGLFQQQLNLSSQHEIFTSQNNLFIIDPITQIIAGVYNKQWYSQQQCVSIPRNINTKNTMLIVDRPDEIYLRLIFEVFDTKQSQFNHKKLLTPLYEIKQGAKLELYLKKNIEKIFTSNAFVHQYFIQRVQKCVTSITKIQQKLSNSNEKSNSYIIDRSEQMGMSKRQVQWLSGSQLSRLFLQKFIMSSQQNQSLFDRLVFGLINNYGVNGLFENKEQKNIIDNKQRSRRQSDNNNSLSFQKRSSLQQERLHRQQQHDIIINQYYHPRCHFTRWNQYFQQIINDQYHILNELFVESGLIRQDRNDSEYSMGVENKFNILYENLKSIKHKLSLISIAYNRFLNLIETTPPSQQHFITTHYDNGINKNTQYYKQRIKQNINKTHSLYLIYDIFDLARRGDNRQVYDKYLQRIQCAIVRVFKEIQLRRKENILMYKRQLLLIGNRPLRIYDNQQQHQHQYNNNNMLLPSMLMLHQHFKNSRMLAISSDQMTFQLFLKYLLLIVNQFEQVAYFYHLLKREIVREQQYNDDGDNVDRMEQLQQQGHSNNNSSNSIDNNNDELIKQKHYPYISRGLINFFYLIESIPLNYNHNQQQYQQRQQQFYKITKQRIQKASRLSLMINNTSFTNYMIQLTALYSMPLVLIKLIDSIHVKAYLNSNESNESNNHYQSLPQQFLYRQKLIMKCLLYVGFNYKSSQLLSTQTLSLREILIYQMKRLLKVNQLIDLEQQQQQSIQQHQQPINIKNTLLQQFITTIIKNSYCQGIRQLQQLKNQYLSLQEDKEHFKHIVNKVIQQTKSSQPLLTAQ